VRCVNTQGNLNHSNYFTSSYEAVFFKSFKWQLNSYQLRGNRLDRRRNYRFERKSEGGTHRRSSSRIQVRRRLRDLGATCRKCRERKAHKDTDKYNRNIWNADVAESEETLGASLSRAIPYKALEPLRRAGYISKLVYENDDWLLTRVSCTPGTCQNESVDDRW
jgi:hypothetical protein